MANDRVEVTVAADTRPYERSLGRAADATSSVDKASADLTREAGRNALKWAAVGTAVTVAGTKALGALKQATEAASDLNESTTKMRTIFGKAAGDIEKFAATSATSLGMSKRAAMDAASMMATFGKAAGLSGKELSTFSTEMLTLSSDLASFYNSSPEEAMEAIGAALRGESEPIRRYGVLLDDATLKNRALEMGIISTVKNALTPQQRALAAQAEILAQTSDAQGDFARTSDGLANSQRQMDAAMEDAKAALGESLLPVLAKGTKAVAGIAQAFAGLPSPVRDTAAGLGLAAAAFAMLAPAGTAAVKGVKTAADAIKGYTTVTTAATVATDGLTASSGRLAGAGGLAALAKGGLIVAGVAALAGTVVAAKKQIDDLRTEGIDRMVTSMQEAEKAGGQLGDTLTVYFGGGEVARGIEEIVAAADRSEVKAGQAREAFAALDAYLAGMSLADARSAYTDLAQRVRESGGSVQTLADMLPGYTAAQKDAARAATEQAGAEEEKAKSLEEAKAAQEKAMNAVFAYVRAQLAAAGASDALAGSEDRLAKANKDNGDALDSRTAKGLANRDALRSEIDMVLANAQAVMENAKANGDTTAEAYAKGRKAIDEGRESLIDAAEAAGYNRDEVEKYVNKLAKIPKRLDTEVQIAFTTSGYAKALLQVETIRGQRSTGLVKDGDYTYYDTNIYGGKSKKGKAAGGRITGPGSGTSDDVAMWGSDGEWVIKEASARKYGPGFMAAVNAGTLSQAQASSAVGSAVSGTSYGMFFAPGAVQVTEATPAGVRGNVIDGLAEGAYRHGVVR